MKPHLLLTALVALGLSFGTPVLRAEGDKSTGSKPNSGAQQPGHPGGDVWKKRMEEMRKKFDANGDGKLDETEKQALREAIKNDPEFKKRHEERLKRFDKNGDGKLDEKERAAAEAEAKAHKGDFKDKALSRFDKNGDGKLDDAERAAAKQEMQQHRGQPGPTATPTPPPST